MDYSLKTGLDIEFNDTAHWLGKGLFNMEKI